MSGENGQLRLPPVHLPPVHEGHLDRAGVQQLFFDIEHAGRFIGARLKEAPGKHSSGTECGLAAALEALDRGQAVGVQLHYEHQTRLWCDTILRQADGYRVVRVDVAAARSSR